MPNLTSRRRDPVLVALGEALRAARRAQAISQDRLALKAEVDRSYVGRVERGDNNVAILTLVRLTNALDISVSQLMRDAGI